MRLLKKYGDKLLIKELKASYNFFIKEANLDIKSKGYGLIKDKDMYADNIASIASVGYGLAALIIGVSRDWISYIEAYKRASKTLDTFLNNVEGKNGFYYHFININTGKREWNCEISIIDTAIFICGAILVGEFFKGKIKQKAEELYTRVNWEWYRNKENNYFYMGYKPETGFWGHWDMYAEQLMLYVLGVASPTFPINKNMYYDIKKLKGKYKNIEEIRYVSRYQDIPTDSFYPFGYGLSYSNFKYRNLKLDKTKIKKNENIIVSVEVENQSDYGGYEVIQLYIQDLYGSVVRPVKELKGFKKEYFNPHEIKNIKFKIDIEMLKFWNQNLEYVAEEGDFIVYVGSNSRDLISKRFLLILNE